MANYAAMSSCYSRYRDRSRWMAIFDDDEFFGLTDPFRASLFSPTAGSTAVTAAAVTTTTAAVEEKRAPGADRRAALHATPAAESSPPQQFPLHALLQWAVQQNSRTPAVAFHPVMVRVDPPAIASASGDSSSDANSGGKTIGSGGNGAIPGPHGGAAMPSSRSQLLPRLGTKRLGSAWMKYEHKMIVQTSMVGMINSHGMIFLESTDSSHKSDRRLLKMNEGAVLHFKNRSIDVFGISHSRKKTIARRKEGVVNIPNVSTFAYLLEDVILSAETAMQNYLS